MAMLRNDKKFEVQKEFPKLSRETVKIARYDVVSGRGQFINFTA